MPTNQERELRESRKKRTGTLGAYLTLKAWGKEIDCVVLERRQLLNYFYLDSTPRDRMRQITTDIKPWFKSHKLYYRENSDTQVHYLFLVRGEDTAHLPQGVYLPLDNAVIRKIIKGLDAEAPRTALFSDLFGEMPTLEGMVSELALLTSGFKTKKNPVDDRK